MAIILGRYDFTNIITILCIWPPYLTFTLMVQIRCFVYKCHIIDRWCMIFYCLGMTRSRQSPVCLRTSRRRLRVGSVPPKGTSFESSHQDPTKTLSTKRNFLWSPSKLCYHVPHMLWMVGKSGFSATKRNFASRLFPPKGITLPANPWKPLRQALTCFKWPSVGSVQCHQVKTPLTVEDIFCEFVTGVWKESRLMSP